MADTVAVKYIYPPDAPNGETALYSGTKRVVVQMTGTSDGTGESSAIKIQLTDLLTASKNTPTRTAVEWIQYTITGITCTLLWDRAPQETIALLDGNGTSISDRLDWTQVYGNVDSSTDGGTGNIVLTTTNADSGDTYDITMSVRLKD